MRCWPSSTIFWTSQRSNPANLTWSTIPSNSIPALRSPWNCLRPRPPRRSSTWPAWWTTPFPRSRSESGQLDLEYHPFELHTCIEESMELLATKAAEKKLDLACLVDDTIPKILVSDVTRLRQILVNLIGNAVKFTQQGEVVIEVAPEAHGARSIPFGHEQDTDFFRHPEQWLLRFSVRDTGIGIPLDRQNRLFKSFQQVDASTPRHYGGTGLGLAISKRLAELMGGKIWVDSDAGKGATFHFTILAKAAAASSPPTKPSPQPQLADKRLLVIEDNATNRRIITQ